MNMDRTISVCFLLLVFITMSPRTLLASVTQQPIATVPEISIQDCYRECNTRLSCQSIGYNRRALFCQIYSQPWVTGLIKREAGVVRKNVGETLELVNTKLCSSSDCINGQSCDDDCKIQECLQPPYSSDLTVLGNMRNINSRIVYVCDNFYTAVYSTCTMAGTWSNVKPECIIYNYKYAGENTAGYETTGSFILQDTFLETCLKKCNDTFGCFGVNYFTTNKSCVSTGGTEKRNVPNSYFYFYSEFPVTVHSKNGVSYDFTFTEGEAFCLSISTSIASITDLALAYSVGYGGCTCGWIDIGYAYLVSNIDGACGIYSPGVHFCWHAAPFNVFCKNKNYRN